MDVVRVSGVPRSEDEKRFLTLVDADGTTCTVEALLPVFPGKEGMIALKGPLSIFSRSFSRALSVSADVPTLARSRARSRSCSRMTDDDECGSDVTSLSRRSLEISRMTDIE